MYEAGKNRLKYSWPSINPVRREMNLRSFFFFFVFFCFFFCFHKSGSVRAWNWSSQNPAPRHSFVTLISLIAPRMMRFVLDYRSLERLPRVFSCFQSRRNSPAFVHSLECLWERENLKTLLNTNVALKATIEICREIEILYDTSTDVSRVLVRFFIRKGNVTWLHDQTKQLKAKQRRYFFLSFENYFKRYHTLKNYDNREFHRISSLHVNLPNFL